MTSCLQSSDVIFNLYGYIFFPTHTVNPKIMNDGISQGSGIENTQRVGKRSYPTPHQHPTMGDPIYTWQNKKNTFFRKINLHELLLIQNKTWPTLNKHILNVLFKLNLPYTFTPCLICINSIPCELHCLGQYDYTVCCIFVHVRTLTYQYTNTYLWKPCS